MPSATTVPYLPHYVPPPPTKEPLEFADLAIIDLAMAHTPEGRAELAQQVLNAMHSHGFFYAINHGWTQEQTDRIFDIADVPFTAVPPEEKKAYVAKMKESGNYQGYKPRQHWHIDSGVRDQLEHYNTNRNVMTKDHPEALRPLLPEMEAFAMHNHYNILHPLLRLLALGLELPEETFVEHHGFYEPGETSIRFLKYYPRAEEDEEKTKNVWLKGHTDIGSVTILWSQPVSGLQILSRDGEWRWIRHMDNAVIINVGDSMEFLSGGFYKGTIHRVTQPPADQRGYPRLGAFYFSMPDDNVRLAPLMESPIVQKNGVHLHFDPKDAPMMEEWRRGRVRGFLQDEAPKKGKESNVVEEYVNGIAVKLYT